MLSAAKHLSAHRERPFAALRVTKHYRCCLLKFIIGDGHDESAPTLGPIVFSISKLQNVCTVQDGNLCKFLTSFLQFSEHSFTIIRHNRNTRMFGNRRICTSGTRCSLASLSRIVKIVPFQMCKNLPNISVYFLAHPHLL